MGIISKCAAVAAVAAIGVGASAQAASAITITGGPAVSATWGSATFSVGGGAYTMSCDGGFAGAVTGATTMAVQPSFTGCGIFGHPITFSSPDDLELDITGGSGGVFAYEVTLPSGTAMTLSAPLAGCTVTISGPQTLGTGLSPVGAMTNVLIPPAAVLLDAYASGIVYTASGCPFSSGTDGAFSGDSALIEGISITP